MTRSRSSQAAVIHAMVTDGLLLPSGEFIPVPYLDEEVFRRAVLKRLRKK